MTLAVPIALLLAAPLPLALVRQGERVPVPGARGVVSEPFLQRLTVTLDPGSRPAALARRLDGDSHLCPKVEAAGDTLVFHCTTERVRATLERRRGTPVLELARLSVPPWRPCEEGPPLTALDPVALGLGPCTGQHPLARGECALAAGDLAAARRHFAEAAKADSAHAQLRLGDLALADDDPAGAVVAWRKARNEAPWSRLAAMRLCELEPGCIGSQVEGSIFDIVGVPHTVRDDAFLRKARLAALRGELVPTVEALAQELRLGGACKAAPGWCRHLLTVALALPPPDGTEALAVYLEWPGRAEGPDALALALAAARQAEAAGAPVWAANLLASWTGRVPAADQPGHLLRVAELFLAGGDRVRADEILRFARTKLSRQALAAPRWTALARRLRGEPRPARAAAPAGDPDLAAARAALEAAKLAGLRKGAPAP